MRTTTEVFEDHLAKRLKGDVTGDIEKNYSEEVVLLTGTGVFRGHDGVRQSAGELKKFVGNGSFRYKHTLVEADYAFLEWAAASGDKRVDDGADGFVIKDGKIIMQSIHYTVQERA